MLPACPRNLLRNKLGGGFAILTSLMLRNVLLKSCAELGKGAAVLRWESSFWRWPVVGRSYRRAAASPALSGALAAAVALTVVASGVYFAAVPSLAAVSPFAQQFLGVGAGESDYPGPLPLTRPEDAGSATAAEADAQGAVAGSGDAQAALLEAGGTADQALLASAANGGGASGIIGAPAAQLIPLAELPGESGSSTDGGSGITSPSSGALGSQSSSTGASSGSSGSSSGGSSGAGSSGGTNGGNAGSGSSGVSGSSGSDGGSGSGNGDSSSGSGSSGSTEQRPYDPILDGLTDEMEAGIAAALRDGFDEMDEFAARMYAFIDDYNRLKMTTDKEPKRESARALSAMLYDAQVAEQRVLMATGEACGIASGGIYSSSRWIPNYEAFQHAYGHLCTCMYQLSNAWTTNIWMDDPTTDVDLWATRLPMTGDVPIEMIEYEKTRKGMRP